MMDMDEAAASLLWVRGIVYFADSYLQNKSSDWMGHIVDIVTTLNPRFKPAYEFAGVTLTRDQENLPRALAILDRGIGEFPEDWKLSVYAAMSQINLDSNYLKAAEYLKPLALKEDVPQHLKTLSATFIEKGGDTRLALAFLVDRYRQSENPINRDIFLQKILQLYSQSRSLPQEAKETVDYILKQVRSDARFEMMGLGVIHGYLTGEMNPGTQAVFNLMENHRKSASGLNQVKE